MSNEKKKGTQLLYSLIAEANSYPDTIVLGRGDPDFSTPAHIIAAAQEAMQTHANDYSPPEGLLSLRQAIAERVKRVNNIEVDPESEVVVTNGGQEAIFLMVLATITSPDDEMIVPDPNYSTYKDALRFAGGTQVDIRTTYDTNFRFAPAQVRQVITDNSRALLMVSPNNPTASVIPPDDVRELVEIAQEHDLIILADDIYDMFLYDGSEHLSPAAAPGGKARSLTLNALSKAYAMTGWRVGWLVGPADLMARVKQLKAATTAVTSVIPQYAGLAALNGPQEPVLEMHRAYAERRRLVLDALDNMGISYGTPQGGQFVFADISSTGMDCIELSKKILREEHVLAYPGSAFAIDGNQYLRITFLQPEDKLREGLERMERAMGKIFS